MMISEVDIRDWIDVSEPDDEPEEVEAEEPSPVVAAITYVLVLCAAAVLMALPVALAR